MRAIAFLAAMLAGTAALANDKTINHAITLANLDRAFEEAAAELGLATVIYNGECDGKEPASCSFLGAGSLEIRGIAASENSPPSNIALWYTADGDATPLAMNIGLLVSIAEPSMKQDSRGKIVSSIIKAVGKGQGLIDGRNADYSVSRIGDTTIVIAEKAKR